MPHLEGIYVYINVQQQVHFVKIALAFDSGDCISNRVTAKLGRMVGNSRNADMMNSTALERTFVEFLAIRIFVCDFEYIFENDGLPGHFHGHIGFSGASLQQSLRCYSSMQRSDQVPAAERSRSTFTDLDSRFGFLSTTKSCCRSLLV